ncbi:MAG: PaaI family thioesterase [Candidatus Hydrogenedentes bacterium]|nr:PaaI family thioesterase [Candidatus Hydrogenedentota bacterium]
MTLQIGYRNAMADLHTELHAALHAVMSASPRTRFMPPPVMEHLEMTFTAYQAGQSLRAAFPARHPFANSAGIVQGGILCASLDCIYGSLAVLATRAPCVTLTLNCTYLRPVPADERPYFVEVRLSEVEGRLIHMEGGVIDQEGAVAVTSTSTMKTVREPLNTTREA